MSVETLMKMNFEAHIFVFYRFCQTDIDQVFVSAMKIRRIVSFYLCNTPIVVGISNDFQVLVDAIEFTNENDAYLVNNA
jgi:hypothetical protein